MAEETNGNLTVYFYDSTGSPMGMRYLSSGSDTWQLYLYDRNLQGDIVGVYNTSGTKLVSYTYDAWGNCTVSYVNGGGFTAAANNPFRYRGYYFDADLGLYYLNSRYYDSNTGRFISADDALYHTLLGYNMYAYCNNNPVMFFDPTGQSAADVLTWWITVGGTTAAVEPTVAGEIILVAGALIIGCVVVGQEVIDLVKSADEAKPDTKQEDPPQSIADSEEVEKDNTHSNNDNKLPTTDTPNTDKSIYDDKGLKQTRHYGSDGKAEYDIDYHHPGKNHKFPHKHNWTWDVNGPTRGKAIDIF